MMRGEYFSVSCRRIRYLVFTLLRQRKETGVTKWKGGPQKYGTAETLTIEKNPKTIAELKASGKLSIIDCKPF